MIVSGCHTQMVDFIEGGELTLTSLKQTTPRGGMHFFYSINPNLEIRNSAGSNKLDVRGTGGYVMMCPSQHYFFVSQSHQHIGHGRFALLATRRP